MATVWTCCVLLFEPVLEARLTEVLSTAFSEVRVTKNFGADSALQSIGYWSGEGKVIATILSLLRDSRCDPLATKLHLVGGSFMSPCDTFCTTLHLVEDQFMSHCDASSTTLHLVGDRLMSPCDASRITLHLVGDRLVSHCDASSTTLHLVGDRLMSHCNLCSIMHYCKKGRID